MNYKVAIIEDEKNESDKLKQFLNEYQIEKSYFFSVDTFSNGYDFFIKYKLDYDVIFLDIQMKGMNGMEVAQKIREKNSDVLIIFVTNLIQYAVEGYSVQAYDFIVKPINYFNFSMKLDRISNYLEHMSKDAFIEVSSKSQKFKLRVSDIFFVEVKNHDVIFHLAKEEIIVRDTLAKMETKLIPYHFARCNSCYLVNIKYITKIQGDYIFLKEEKLRISQSKRFSFLGEVAKYFGGTK